MLAHVIEAQILDLVIGRVDFLVRVLHFTLDGHRSGISLSASGGVVGAGVTALGLDEGDLTVLYSSACAWNEE